MAKPAIQESPGGVIFTAKVVPGSSRTTVCGLHDGMVKIKISAPPEKGKANQSLTEFLAKTLDIKKNAVSIIAGQSSPAKQIQAMGIDAQTLLNKLNLNESRS